MFDFTRHFLSNCVRILGLEHRQMTGGFLAVEYAGRTVMVRVSHIGVTPAEWKRPAGVTVALMEGISAEVTGLMEQCKASTVMTSLMNGFDRLKGAPFQLLAFERLLDECKQWRGEAKLIMLCPKPPKQQSVLLPEEDLEDEEQVGEDVTQFVEDQWAARAEVIEYVNRINDRYKGEIPEPPVLFLELDLSPEERREVYAMSDIVLVTPIRDGLNLIPYEYIATEPNEYRTAPGAVLILSEFTGCSRALCGGIRVNPWNLEEFVRGMDKALSTPEKDRRHMRAQDLKYVSNHTTGAWARSFMDDLEQCYEPKEKMTSLGLGFGMSFNTLEPSGQSTNSLEYESMSEGYMQAEGRLFLLDCEGTIKVDGTRPPSGGIIAALTDLCADSKNLVIVMSGRPKEKLLA